MNFRNLAVACAIPVLLTACGGSDDDSAVNTAPTASSVSIGGALTVGQTLTGQYAYSDANGDAEAASTFRWLRDGVVISGATTNSLVVTAADVGKSLVFAVTPMAATGTLAGNETQSSASAVLTNTAPTVTNVSIEGTPAVGQTLTGQYTYVDLNNDGEGATTFSWLRNGVVISGETNNTYVTTSADIGNQITFAVTPSASSGVTAGGEVSSGTITAFESVFVSKCNATTEATYIDSFINSATADRAWVNSGSNSAVEQFDVAYIAAQFNAGRAGDTSIKDKLKMPTQSVWDGYDSSQKMLYLVNSERCARGLVPFEGIDPRMVGSAQTWADHLTANDVFNHGSGTNSIPNRFIAVGVDTTSGGNADFMTQSENLAFFSKFASSQPTIDEVEARSVYNWMYDDKVATSGSYGHRTFILIKGLSGGSGYGPDDTEGLFGGAVKFISGTTMSGGFTLQTSKVNIVMHAFDPNANYLPNSGDVITPAPAFIPPTSQDDCLSGTFQAASMSCN